MRNGLLSSLSIGHDAGKLNDLADPPAIFLTFNFNEKIHRWANL